MGGLALDKDFMPGLRIERQLGFSNLENERRLGLAHADSCSRGDPECAEALEIRVAFRMDKGQRWSCVVVITYRVGAGIVYDPCHEPLGS